MSKKGVIICGHGSRSVEAVNEFRQLYEKISMRYGDEVEVEFGFLEFAKPNIIVSLNKLVDKGVRYLDAAPGMLFAAGHVKNDVVAVLNDFKYQFNHKNPDDHLEINFAADLGIDPKLLKLSKLRIQKAIEKTDIERGEKIANEDSLLLVIGRGTTDPDANSNIAKVARIIAEGMGFGWHEVGYSGVTYPLVGPAIEHAVRLDYQRIIVFPYFLFTGILVDRIYSIVDEMADKRDDIEFVKAEYLNSHENVVDVFCERIKAIYEHDNDMNCLLCKYREQIIGFEDSQGEAQHGHHYHVQADIDGDDNTNSAEHSYSSDHNHSHSHPHGHDNEHDHSHSHPPHPFADHPHGPNKRDPKRL